MYKKNGWIISLVNCSWELFNLSVVLLKDRGETKKGNYIHGGKDYDAISLLGVLVPTSSINSYSIKVSDVMASIQW